MIMILALITVVFFVLGAVAFRPSRWRILHSSFWVFSSFRLGLGFISIRSLANVR
jgi:hypothetical protein